MRKTYRKSLFVTPTILRGRRLKEGEEEGGATGGGDNNGGNSGGSANPGSDSNNDGQTFDASAFWGNSEEGAGTNPSGESASNQPGSESGSSGGQNLQEVLTGRLESMAFGDPIFNAEIAEQINSGNFEGVEARIQGQLRNAVRGSLGLMVQIMKPFAEQLTNQMREEMSGTFNSRDDNQALETMFPAAKNPQVRPIVNSIFTQALKNTKGNRAEAVKQTKEMLKLAAGVTADDLDLSIAPRGAEDSGRPATAVNWLDELSVR